MLKNPTRPAGHPRLGRLGIGLLKEPSASHIFFRVSKLQAIIAIITTSAGIIGGAWVGALLAGWIGAMLFFPFGGGIGYLVGARPQILLEFIDF